MTETISSPATTQPTATSQPSTPTPTPTPSPEGTIDITQFAAVKLRVAQIISVEKVEKSNKLFKLQVDLGPLGKRQIVSGIAKFYTPEQLLGRKIIVVANLKPAMLMGVESHGMLLAASSDDKSQLSVLTPGEDVPLGAAVS
jgi:methionyl-tRNA synthetase